LPNLQPSLRHASVLNQGPFPLPALPGFISTTGLSATPRRPACPSRASGWSSHTTPRGFPCCVRFPCVHAIATTPAQRLGACFAHFPSRISLPRNGSRVGLRNVLFEACSAFTRVTACTLALSPYFVTRFTEFVTSTVAPVASGWSGCRVGLSPTGKAPPFHGARQEQTFRQASFSGTATDHLMRDQGVARAHPLSHDGKTSDEPRAVSDWPQSAG
jgi:hypothetical protein